MRIKAITGKQDDWSINSLNKLFFLFKIFFFKLPEPFESGSIHSAVLSLPVKESCLANGKNGQSDPFTPISIDNPNKLDFFNEIINSNLI